MTEDMKGKKQVAFGRYILFLFLAFCSILIYKFIPFFFFGAALFITFHLQLLYYSFLSSRYSFSAAIGNLVVGYAGILLQPYFALHVLSFNIIHYIWLFYLGSGSINVVFYFIFLIARKIYARKNKALVESV